ncbi:MAG: PG0541 family transporter-associated protein [Planctomycetota bacterium]
MKWLHITFRFEFADAVEAILDRHGIQDFVRSPMVEGRDCDGKHYGSQVFPGNMTVVQAHVPDETVEPLLDDLREFREAREAHRHLRAVVLPVEQRL